jgi:hypothetical protein
MDSAGGPPSRAELEAAALHFMRTRETEIPVDEMTMARVTEYLRLEGLRLSACGACMGCSAGQDCKLAAITQAGRDGKQGALWAEQGQKLVGRVFKVCQQLICHCCAPLVAPAPRCLMDHASIWHAGRH